MRLPVLQEDPAQALTRLSVQYRARGVVWLLIGCAFRVFLFVQEVAEQREEHVVRRLVLWMCLEYCPLEILHGVDFTVGIAALLHLFGDGVTLLGQAAVAVPIVEEFAAHGLACLREGLRAC